MGDGAGGGGDMDNDEKEKKKERDALPLTWSDIFIGNSVSDATVDSKLRNNDTIAPVTDDDNNNNDDANDIQIIGDDSTRAYLGGLGQLLLDKLRSYRHVVNQVLDFYIQLRFKNTTNNKQS